ncbi:MAG: NifU family protein [Planctomycetota bacterium]
MSPDSVQQRVQAVLHDLMPLLRVDGGGLELERIEGDTVYVRLTGACIGCPGADITLRYGIESALTEAIPEVKRVIAVETEEGSS